MRMLIDFIYLFILVMYPVERVGACPPLERGVVRTAAGTDCFAAPGLTHRDFSVLCPSVVFFFSFCCYSVPPPPACRVFISCSLSERGVCLKKYLDIGLFLPVFSSVWIRNT